MMLSLSYPFEVLLFSALVGVLVFALLLKKKKGPVEFSKAMNSRFIIAIVFVLIIAPSLVFDLQHYGKFADPDSYSYVKDLNMMSQIGRIPSRKDFAEDSFYLQFPVFILIVNTISQVMAVSSVMAMYIFNAIIQLIFWACAWILLKNSTRALGLKGENAPISMIIVAFADVYLYGFLGSSIPQVLGLAVLLLLLLSTSATATLGNNIMFTLFSILALVHVGVIPFLLVVLVLDYVVQHLFQLRGGRHSFTTFLIPLIVYSFYLVVSPALGRVLVYSHTIVDFFASLLKNLAQGSAVVNPGISRPFAPLNALAPAFILGANLAFIIWSLVQQRRKKESPSSFYVGISIASVLAVGIGSLRQRFEVIQGAGSISRYFALPGYALGVVGTLIALNIAIIPFILDKSRNRALRALLILFLVLIVVGGLLEPFAFRPPVPNPI